MYDYDNIADFFNKTCDAYGGVGWAASAWSSAQSQQDMYYVLSRVGISGSVLDVGCGQGDYCDFLHVHYPGVEYTGIDISDKMLGFAREKHPGREFRHINLIDYNERCHDWVIGAGSFNMRIGTDEEQKKYIYDQIGQMFHLANKGVALSLLGWYHSGPRYWDSLHYYKPEEIFERCFDFTYKVVIDHSTLPTQFAVYLLK